MQEYRAAAPLDARLGVVIDLDNEIIEMIVAPEPVAALLAIQPHRLVVIAAPGIFAPGVVRLDGANRQKSAGTWMAVGAPPQLPRPERAFRGPAIAFALIGPDAATPKCDGHYLAACHQPAPARIAGSGANSDHGQGPIAQVS